MNQNLYFGGTQSFYFGGGSTETTMAPAAITLLLLAGALILFLSRKFIIIPVLLATFLIPAGQSLVVGGVHLTPARIIALFGWARLTGIKLSGRNSIFLVPLNSIDRAFSWSVIGGAFAFILLWMQSAALVNQFGALWTSMGMYFLLRALISDEEDIYRAARVFAMIAAVNALGMVSERLTFQNVLGTFMGGATAPSIRDGSIRAQGLFGHPILAGIYGATILPVFLMLGKNGKATTLAVIGVISSIVMVYTCASSTPALAIVAGLFALFLWPIRKQMRIVRWGIGISLVALHIVMKAPVWFLIARMDVLGASSGYHRAELVDVFIRHFSDWWLLGTKDRGGWGWDMWDVSNQFIAKGEAGGLIAFVFFLILISRSFGRLGKSRKSAEGSRSEEWMMWFLCAALFAHIMAFFGASYWDQNEFAWYALLAMICAATRTKISESASGAKVEPLESQVSYSAAFASDGTRAGFTWEMK